MNEILITTLKTAGWKPGTFRGFLRTNRAGIEFEVGPARGSEDRLELRYRYRTETTNTEGDVALPPDATREKIEDVMTGIYLRIHEKPDPTRVFGMRRTKKPPVPVVTAAPTEPDKSQGTLDF
jgi:hypothetical protein